MDLKESIVLFFVLLPVFFIIDFTWIGFFANKMYKNELAHLIRKNSNGGIGVLWLPAIIFYLIYIVGIILFVISKAVDEDSITIAGTYGAFFGFCMYATYDLTNLATINKWPLKVTLVDLAWGSFLTSLISIVGFLMQTKVL